jgi:hypothetical protein
MKGKNAMTLKRRLGAFLLAGLMCGLTEAPAWGYEEVTISDAGTLSGTVTLAGEAPLPQRFELRRSPDRTFCGALSDGSGYRQLREVATDAQGGLKDVVVTIEDIAKGKPFELEEAKIEANVCQFVPFVSVVRNRHPLTVTNLDPVAHDLQVYERDRDHVYIMFHRPALTKTGTTDQVRFTAGRREMTMQCGMHPFMQGHGLAVENPYYAVTGHDGGFTITEIPPGTYRVRMWHPAFDVQEQSVTIESRAETKLDVGLSAR